MSDYAVLVQLPGIQGPTGGSADWASPGAAIGTGTPVAGTFTTLTSTGATTVGTNLTVGAGSFTQARTVTNTSGVVTNSTLTLTTTPSGTSTAITQGIEIINGSTGSADMSGAVLSGASFVARHANSTALGSLYGFSSTARQTSTGGGITNVFGTNFIVQNQSASAGIGTARAVYIGSATDSGGGITTNIGLQIDNQTAGGTNYAILTGTGLVLFGDDVEIDGDLNHDGSAVGFYGTAPAAKPTVTGSKGANAALTSLMTALSGLGLVTDSTS